MRCGSPTGFVWGAATAAYQIEGAAREDGRGPSIWDTFSRTPGKVYAGHTGDVACDHYHRYADDVALMAELGLRVVPVLGRLAADPAGRHRPGQPARPGLLRPADRRAARPGHRPDGHALPLGPAADAARTAAAGPSGETAEAFAEYAQIVYARLGDRVRTWTTLNEPWCSAYLGLRQRRARARPAGPGRGVRRRAPPAARPRPGGAGAAVGGRADHRHHAEPGVGVPGRPGQRRRPGRRPHRRRPVTTGSSSTRCCAAGTRPTCSSTWPGSRDLSFIARRRRGDHQRADRRARR